MSSNNIEMMKKIIEEKKKKSSEQGGVSRPDKVIGKQKKQHEAIKKLAGYLINRSISKFNNIITFIR